MQYRPLGTTGIEVSAVSFGAGPISTLMTGDDSARQRAVIKRAVEAGVNWFDTATTYGDGQSESNLGRVLEELGAASHVHVATKVRLVGDDCLMNQVRSGAMLCSIPQHVASLWNA
jgi:aryl-alcohol dehydrogenase-like predicted oxidoreductase